MCIKNIGMVNGQGEVISVGIDIGTTTVSAVVYDIDNKRQIEAISIPHNSYICSDVYFEQSVSEIIEMAEKMLYRILKSYTGIVSIGITGQMHGIAYYDADGNAVSNLITWQDKRAEQMLGSGKSTCQIIKCLTEENVPTGYGIASHCYNVISGIVPDQAVGFCSIMDLFAMKICGIKKAVTHSSVAASFGLFDIKSGSFMIDKLSLLGIDAGILPSVTGESLVIGECRGIPVSVAIGDNQASFLGSVRNNADSMLVNIGTGSQISAVSDYYEPKGELELRPFIEGKYLVCGSALCGGFAYSMLESFFRSYAVSAGMKDEPQYRVINQLAEEAYLRGEKGLSVDVSFCGKRSDPDCRGSVTDIGKQNFTPSSLALGVLKGMCNELYELYSIFPEKKAHAVASGGAVKKNKVLRSLIAERFDALVSVNSAEEEAARGAALFSALSVGKAEYINGFSNYITYQ